jgi:hypothetical protein
METHIENTAAPSVEVPRLVRLLRSVWSDVGLSPREAVMGIAAGILIATPVMLLVWATAWLLCYVTGKPMTDDAMAASVGVLFLLACCVRAVSYANAKWRESGKPNAKEMTRPLTGGVETGKKS